MLAEVPMRRVRCTPALAALLLFATACATRTRTTNETGAAQPPAAVTQPAEAKAPAGEPAAPPASAASVAAAPVATGAAQPKTPPAGLPTDHVKDKDGVMHKRGYKAPFGDCTNCHGKELRGEGRAPSCYRCHGREWH